MKLHTIVITLALALAMAGTAQAVGGKHDHKPLHGGVVVEGKEQIGRASWRERVLMPV